MRHVTNICAALVLCAACTATQETNIDAGLTRAQYRVVQGVLDAPSFDVYHSRSEQSPDFPHLDAGAATGYVGVNSNAYDIVFKDVGTGNIRTDLSTRFAQSSRYFIVASGSYGGAMVVSQYDDDFDDAGAGTTLVSLVNATADGGSVDVSAPADVGASDAVSAPGLVVGTSQDVDFKSGVAVPLTVSASGVAVQFTTVPLPEHAWVKLVVAGTSSDPSSLQLLYAPPVDVTNSTAIVSVARDPSAIFINGVPSLQSATLTVNDQSLGTLAFGAATQLMQVGPDLTVKLGDTTATLSGSLDGNATYVVVLAPAAGGGVTLSAFADAIADAADARLRVINATLGTSAVDVSLTPTQDVADDLVFGAASAAAGASFTAPASVTGIVATGTPTLSYVTSDGLPASTRYVVLVGDVASSVAAVLVQVVNGEWSASMVLGVVE